MAGKEVQAHRTNLTKSDIAIDGAVLRYRLSVGVHDLAVALAIPTDLATPVPQAVLEQHRQRLDRYLSARLLISEAGRPCERTASDIDYRGLPDEIQIELTYDCETAISALLIDYRLFFDIDPAHRSLGVLEAPGHREELLFDRGFSRLELSLAQPGPPETWARRFGRILLLGAEHILAGADHLLFLAALLIVTTRLWPLIKVVTAFTIAHSLTLGLAWYQVIALPNGPVEAAVALSIVVVGVQNILGRGSRHRWILAGLFGLLHGLGFYSALADLDLAGAGLLTTLAAFNIGVELGQLAIVAILFGPLLWWSQRAWYPASMKALSLVMVLVAGWWTFERALLI